MSLGGINGATDAVALAVGDFTGSVTSGAGGFAGLVTLGSFILGSVSGGDAIALTQGNLGGSVIASNDAAALAIGSITGNVSSGRDSALAAFGAINSTVSAGRDITDVWAVGDINGTYNASNDISDIFSGGAINAGFTASSGDIAGANTVGDIAGSFTAGTSIGDLIAGGNITASRSAGILGGLFPNDLEMQNWTPPDTPVSITSEVQVNLASALAAVTQSVTEYATQATQALSDAQTALSDAQTATTDALNAAEANLAANNTQKCIDAANGLQSATDATNDAFADAVNQAMQSWNELQDEVENMSDAATAANANAMLDSDNMLAAVDAQIAGIAAAMGQADGEMTNRQTDASSANAADLVAHVEQWKNTALLGAVNFEIVQAPAPASHPWGWDNGWIQYGIGGILGLQGWDVFRDAWIPALASTADGLIPFGDPFSDCYDDTNPVFAWSRGFAAFGRDVALTRFIPNLTAWARSPLWYELGQTTVARAVFVTMENMSAIERGRALYRLYGWSAPFRGFLVPAQFAKTIGTHLTPAGWIGVIGGVELIDYIGVKNIWDYIATELD